MSRLKPGQFLSKNHDLKSKEPFTIGMLEVVKVKEEFESTGIIPQGWSICSWDELEQMGKGIKKRRR